jgi:hypothetical protein
MSADHIRYDLLLREALRGVVRRVVADVAENGLPGEHHLYISFDTNADGVRISPRLKAQYPQEMTVILQHQFWDLAVTDTGFEVGLSFGGVPEKLGVPFDSLKGFFDPSVQFGLEFETASATDDLQPGEQTPSSQVPAVSAEPLAKPRTGRNTNERQRSTPALVKQAEEAPANAPETKSENAGADIVRLDRFRKK